jgi:hypothetical protein
MKKNESRNWMNYVSNPIGHAVRKFVYEILGAERYSPHEQIIEQLTRSIFNDSDYENFGKLVAEIYEAGFMRAVDEQKEELTRLGLKVTLKTTQKTEGVPIFNQKNPADFQ